MAPYITPVSVDMDAMDPRISHLQAKASEVRHMAQVATIDHVRAELFEIANQYERMATAISRQQMAKPLLRDVTVFAVCRKRGP